MAKGNAYIRVCELSKLLNIPNGCRITNIIHDPKTDEVEFILHSEEEIDHITFDTRDGACIPRVSLNELNK